MKKLIVFLSLIVLSNIAFSASEQDAELRLYSSGNLYQRFYGVVQQNGNQYIFINREPPQPIPQSKSYAAWRLIPLTRDIETPSIYHLGNYIPVNDNCIVPFINGIMSINFIYNKEFNYIQFMDGEVPEIFPEDYTINTLLLLSPE